MKPAVAAFDLEDVWPWARLTLSAFDLEHVWSWARLTLSAFDLVRVSIADCKTKSKIIITANQNKGKNHTESENAEKKKANCSMRGKTRVTKSRFFSSESDCLKYGVSFLNLSHVAWSKTEPILHYSRVIIKIVLTSIVIGWEVTHILMWTLVQLPWVSLALATKFSVLRYPIKKSSILMALIAINVCQLRKISTSN